MNTWRNTEKPPLNQPIFITDGETVYFGHYEISPISKSAFFIGADLENGDVFTIAPDGLRSITGWQPAPDTWKPEKTADEMFAEFGAKRCPLIKNPFSGRRAYKRMDNRYNEYRYEFTGDAVFAYVNGVSCGITIEEIPAIAQALAELQQELMEMEVNNG